MLTIVKYGNSQNIESAVGLLRTEEYSSMSCLKRFTIGAITLCLHAAAAAAQVPPSPGEASAYTGLHAAAAAGDADRIRRLAAASAALEARDSAG